MAIDRARCREAKVRENHRLRLRPLLLTLLFLQRVSDDINDGPAPIAAAVPTRRMRTHHLRTIRAFRQRLTGQRQVAPTTELLPFRHVSSWPWHSLLCPSVTVAEAP